MLSCDGELKADENWMSAKTLWSNCCVHWRVDGGDSGGWSVVLIGVLTGVAVVGGLL